MRIKTDEEIIKTAKEYAELWIKAAFEFQKRQEEIDVQAIRNEIKKAKIKIKRSSR